MKNVKKLIAAAVAVMLVVVGVTSCGSTPDPVDVKVMALKGPTAMGMVQFMSEAEAGNYDDNNYSFEIAASVDEVAPALMKGDVDIAAVPANMASVLYNKQENIQVLGVNTLGVIYICETGDTVKSVSDLKGRTIYASGKGATPEYSLNYILEKNGLDPEKDVNIQWKSEHSECVAALANDSEGIAMIPQPFVAAAQAKNSNIRVALDLTEEWEKVAGDDGSTMITGVVVARKDFVENNPEAVEAFLEHYRVSVDYVNENTDEGAALVGKYDIVPEAVAKKAIPECNIVLITGEDMKTQLSGYLKVLGDQNPAAVGGGLPADGFYYTGR